MYEYEYLKKATWRLFTDPDPIKLHCDLDQDSDPEHYADQHKKNMRIRTAYESYKDVTYRNKIGTYYVFLIALLS